MVDQVNFIRDTPGGVPAMGPNASILQERYGYRDSSQVHIRNVVACSQDIGRKVSLDTNKGSYEQQLILWITHWMSQLNAEEKSIVRQLNYFALTDQARESLRLYVGEKLAISSIQPETTHKFLHLALYEEDVIIKLR